MYKYVFAWELLPSLSAKSYRFKISTGEQQLGFLNLSESERGRGLLGAGAPKELLCPPSMQIRFEKNNYEYKPPFPSRPSGSSAVSMAVTSATFSVLGAINLFVGIQILAGIAASSLELGKFSAAAYIHSNWNQLNGVSKVYLSITLGLLMLISSGDIFFQLSSGFAESSARIAGTTALVDEWKSERDNATAQLKAENDRISKITSAYLQRLARSAAEADISQAEVQIKDLNTKIGDGIATSASARLNSGPITLLATTLGCTVGTTQTVIVALFTTVFDPLAVVLVMLFASALEGCKAKRISGKTQNARIQKTPKRRRAKEESTLSPAGVLNSLNGSQQFSQPKVVIRRKDQLQSTA